MPKSVGFLWVLSLLALLVFSWISGGANASGVPGVEITPVTTETLEERESWIWLDLPPDASQLELGKEVYRLVCSACHAYDGTGLTKEWRETWNPKDQNCWQSKCHSLNHPPDGFFLPYSPPVVGPIIPALFETAYDLYEYNLFDMPWHNPFSMTHEEVWAVTAYLLEMNGYDPGEDLEAESARLIRLRVGDNASNAAANSLDIPTSMDSEGLDTEVNIDREAAFPMSRLGFGIGLIILGVFSSLFFLKHKVF